MSSIGTTLRSFLPKGHFARSVMVLAGGATLGQGLVVLASPLLTRLYTREDFGVLAVYAAILGIVVVIASLRYELAIPLPEDDADAANLAGLSLGIVLVISLMATIVVLLFGDTLADWLHITALVPYLWFLPVGIFLAGIYQVLNYWAVRKKSFPSIARTKLNQGLGSVLTQVGLGLIRLGPIGLICGQVVGQAAGSTTLATLAWRENKEAFKGMSFVGMWQMAKRYLKFPLFSSFSGFANVLSLQLVILLLSFFYGPVVTGLYALGHRVLQAPMGIIVSAVSQVFYREAVEAYQEGTLPQLVQATYKKLALIAAVPFIVMLIFAPTLFAVVFGEVWRDAGNYTRVLLPWLFLMFLNSPLTNLIAVLEKQQVYLIYDTTLLFGRTVALYASAIYVGKPLISVICYGAVGFVFNLGLFFYLLHLSRAKHAA